VAKKPKVIYESDKMYRLLEDREQGLILEVVCGTAAQYAVRMALNDSEKEQYAKGRVEYLDSLADQVARDEPKYRAQGRTTPV
jgi:hypothetical protein